MIRAYQFALEPTPAQVELMLSHCGGARVAYNWCLARVKANWDQRAAEASYGIAEEDRTPFIETSYYSLQKAWTAAKHEVAPWWAENCKFAYDTGCRNLAAAVSNRKARRAGMPRFKSKSRSRKACRFGNVRLGPDSRHIWFPAIHLVRTAESTRKLARKIRRGDARIRSGNLSYQHGRWHVSLSVETSARVPDQRSARTVGVDLGIAHLATLSTGEQVRNARHLEAELTGLRRAQRVCARRRGPDRRTRTEPSNRWRKAQAKADHIQTRVANLRRNDTHHLTTRLVREFDTIVIEDLHVAGMVKNRNLARHIYGANWAEIRRQLTYKCEWYGKTLIVADRWFASSKTCSGCGAAKTKLALSERTYGCTACGRILDRDENAARNLAALANTPQLVGELPAGSGVRPAEPAQEAVALPREGSLTQRHLREEVAR